VAHANADAVGVIDCRKWEATGSLAAGRGPDGLGFTPIRLRGVAPEGAGR